MATLLKAALLDPHGSRRSTKAGVSDHCRREAAFSNEASFKTTSYNWGGS